MSELWINPKTPLVLYTLLGSIAWGVYGYEGWSPTDGLIQLTGFFNAILICGWAVADARQSRNTPCFDFGQLCWQLFYIAIPWYCLRSRGWRGLLILFFLLGVLVFPSFLYTTVLIAVHGLVAAAE